MAVPLVYLQYSINKDFIAANLCENVAKPQLQCEGKCHLKKQVEKNTDTPNPSGEKSSGKVISIDCFLESDDSLSQICCFSQGEFYSYYYNLYTHLHSSLIFHPPLYS